MPFFRNFFLFSLAVFLFWTTERFCHKKTDGFQIVKILSRLPSYPQWDTPEPTFQEMADLQEVFSQPFFFLDSGGQCYAFVSKDGKIVLKLFKMHHLRQYPVLHKIPFPGICNQWKTQFLHFQKQKLDKVFSSSHIAYTQLQAETGLLYLNLNPKPQFENLHVTLIDKIGIEHTLSLKDIPFVLQHKADNAFQILRFHLLHRDMTAAKEVIRDIVECLTARYKKGIKDTDPALRRNIGLLKKGAISIDIGSFVRPSQPMSPEDSKRELLNDTRRMRRWLQKRSLELTSYFDALIAEAGNETASGDSQVFFRA